MKVIIDLEPAVQLFKIITLNVVAPIVILLLSLVLGTRVTDIKKVDEWRIKKRINTSSNFISSLFSSSNFQIIVSSILYVLLYNFLIIIK